MLYLITGGSCSGKSLYAEKLAAYCESQKTGLTKLYVATMFPRDDEETRDKIEKHQSMRKGKGFVTVEQGLNIGEIAADENSVVLIECLSNLLANEMFEENGALTGDPKEKKYRATLDEKAKAYIANPIIELADKVHDVIVVTNEVFSDIAKYDAATREYVRILGELNQKITVAADCAVEVVCGIPLKLKGEIPC